MEGSGCFTHPSSYELEGQFKANYYVYSDLILNPFIEGDEFKEEIRLQEEARKKNAKMIENSQKQVKIHRLLSPNELLLTIRNIDKTNRVPIIISSTQSFLRKSDIKMSFPNNTFEIDLRDLVSYRKINGKDKTKEFLRNLCIQAFTTGGILFLNLDDSDVKYEELYYPDLQEFFNPVSFPATLFKPDVMKRPEV